MKPSKPEKIESITDIFHALMGGKPDDLSEIKAFLQNNELAQLLSATDIDNIFRFDGYFAEEIVDAVYTLLPITIPLKGDKQQILFPQTFRRLNQQKADMPHSRIIDVDFGKALRIFSFNYNTKIMTLVRMQREQKQKKEAEEALKKYFEQKETEKKSEIPAPQSNVVGADRKEQARLRMRKYRAEHPEKVKSYYKKLETLPLDEQEKQRETNRLRNKKYRDKNAEAIRARHNQYRAKMKEENPELLKEMDRQHNMTEGRRISGKKYYQTHKEEINLKAKNNPNVKIYKQRYKNKKRFQEKTGIQILSLLQGIINTKNN